MLRYEPETIAIPLLVKLADNTRQPIACIWKRLASGATDREAAGRLRHGRSGSTRTYNPVKIQRRGSTGDLKLDFFTRSLLEPPALCRHHHGEAGRGKVDVAGQPARFRAIAMTSCRGQLLRPSVRQATASRCFRPFRSSQPMTGDAAAGEKVFRNTTTAANCMKCHQIGNEGGTCSDPPAGHNRPGTHRAPQLYDCDPPSQLPKS